MEGKAAFALVDEIEEKDNDQIVKGLVGQDGTECIVGNGHKAGDAERKKAGFDEGGEQSQKEERRSDWDGDGNLGPQKQEDDAAEYQVVEDEKRVSSEETFGRKGGQSHYDY